MSRLSAAVTMMKALPSQRQNGARGGFTLIEALIVAGIIGLLATLILPALSNAKGRAYRIVCLNNERQLTIAWNLYAEDREGYLPYNFGIGDTLLTISNGLYQNWANNVLSWKLDSENTNDLLLARGGLGPYLVGVVAPFRCPSDRALSEEQRAAGWRERTRSYSMNAMVGHPGNYLKSGRNMNNPKYKQFMRIGEIPDPSGIFVFIEEHPHSINDGYFLYKHEIEPSQWYDLPASYHDRGANVAFADLHIEYRKWVSAGTVQPPVELPPGTLPMSVEFDRRDYDWLMQRTTVAY